MTFITNIVNLYFTKRRREIEHFMKNPAAVQEEQLKYLLATAKDTVFGKEHRFGLIPGINSFQASVPVTDYENFSKYILSARDGVNNVLWPSATKWFAKSSGTTDAQSKYIPVTDEGLADCHFQGPRDVIALFSAAYPDSKVFSGKTLTLGGSKKIVKEGSSAFAGDLSAILIENTPAWANLRRVPSVSTALIPDFEEKVKRICEETVGENVTCFAGVPSWNLVMLNRILEYSGKKDLLEIWPNMELFIHGGMNFKPYKEQYRKIIPTDWMKYMETYNASEGFFSIADDPSKDDMLLMLDYHTFYEFLPIGSMDDTSKAVPLEGVVQGVNYAMIISNSNGLWRYMIGDTVEFTSVDPYRIRITGRTKHYINAFGEEVIVDNAERALEAACNATGAVVTDYTVAPIYMDGKGKGSHEWLVEFRRPPSDLENFTVTLDGELQELNSDYKAKRFRDTTLTIPYITVVPEGTFRRWMTERGREGGQNKVPRLYNDRTYADQILKLKEGLARQEEEKIEIPA